MYPGQVAGGWGANSPLPQIEAGSHTLNMYGGCFNMIADYSRGAIGGMLVHRYIYLLKIVNKISMEEYIPRAPEHEPRQLAHLDVFQKKQEEISALKARIAQMEKDHRLAVDNQEGEPSFGSFERADAKVRLEELLDSED